MDLKDNVESNKYEEIFDAYISQIKDGLENDLNNSFSVLKSSKLLEEVISLLEVESNTISSEFVIPLNVKNYFLLIRNTHIEFEKAKLRFFQQEITTEQLQTFCEKLFSNIKAATNELVSTIKQKLNIEYSDLEKENYSEIKSPWNTFKSQYEKIIEQINVIDKSYLKLTETKPLLDNISKAILNGINQNTKSFEALSGSLSLFEKSSLKTETSLEELNQIYKEIDTQIHLIPAFTNNLDSLLEPMVKQLPEIIKIPVSAQEGILSINTLPLQKQLRDWINLEILPEIYEVWELNDEVSTKIKASSKNILNRIKLALNTKDSPVNSSYFSKTISILRNDFDISHSQAQVLSQHIKDQVTSNLETNHFFNNKTEFLAPTWRSTINNSSIEESPIVITSKKWLGFVKTKASSYIHTLLDEHEPNVSETIINYLRSAEQNIHSEYNSIFLTKSFSGKSFYVPRLDASQIANKSLENWINGYRGGLLIKGNRFSGKSNFINAFVEGQTKITHIEIFPEQTISYNGRKFTPTFDLGEALNFLSKYNFGDKIIIVIDDVLQWQSADILFTTNIKSLLKFVDQLNSKFFVVGSIDKCQLEHYDKSLHISNSFNSTLSLEKIKIENFYKVIDIRHGVTHKSIVSKDGSTIQPDQFKKYIKKVYHEGEGNVGDALRIWALSLVENENGNMNFNLFNVEDLPDFLNEENSIVLRVLALHREASEYQFRSLLGPSFLSKYKDVLSRLISVGIIERNNYNNKLMLAESITNQVTDKLKCEGYI